LGVPVNIYNMLQALVAYKGSKNIIRCGQNNFQFKHFLKWENFYFSNLVLFFRHTNAAMFGVQKASSASFWNIRPVRRTLPLNG